MTGFPESILEDAALAWLEALGCTVLHGSEVAAGMPTAEHSDPNYREVVLEGVLRQALARLNPHLPGDALEDVYRKLTCACAPLLERNRAVHRMLVNGVLVEYRPADDSIAGARAKVIDSTRPTTWTGSRSIRS